MLDILPRGPAPANDDSEMFELAPVSLWLEDFSGVRTLFDAWRAEGVTDLRAHFAANPGCVAQCAHSIRVIKVNQKTLTQFEAADFDALTGNLASVFRDDMLKTHLEELCQLWAGQVAVHQPDGQLHARRTPPRRAAQGRRAARPRGALGPRAGVGRRHHRTGRRAASRDACRAVCARPVRAFAGVALGGGFQRGQASARRSARGRHQRFPRVHRRASRVRRALHAGDPRARREPAHARHVRRERQENAARRISPTCSATTCVRISASS